MPNERQLLTVRESAALLCLSENTIRQWIWQRRLPVVRLGRAVRLKRQDLEKLIDQNREEAMTWSSHV
jgi:excisionase family DNA binding protein